MAESGGKGGRKRVMSEDQKQSIALGRRQNRAVDEYLRYLESAKPKRGRKRDVARVEKQLELAQAELATASGVRRLDLMQKIQNLEEELQKTKLTTDVQDIEDAFIEHAAAYSQRKGISYKTWIAVGVPAEVLMKAGIPKE